MKYLIIAIISSIVAFSSLSHADNDEDGGSKPISKKCQNYQKLMDSYVAKVDTMKQDMYRELLTAKSKKDEARIITKYNKIDDDLARKLTQLGLNPKYKDCDGNLSEAVGIKGN